MPSQRIIVSPDELKAYERDCAIAVGPAREVRIMPQRRFARIEVREAGEWQWTQAGHIDLGSGCVYPSQEWARPGPIPVGNLLDPLDPSRGRAAIGPDGVRGVLDVPLDERSLWDLRQRYAPGTISDGMRRRRVASGLSG